ncbi:MAG: DUF3857 domain-containing protein [Bacteroidales bacterium]|nr:DUF3857 domain-containing protein [Bacteroidales bacterium]
MKYFTQILLTGLLTASSSFQILHAQILTVSAIPENLLKGANSVVRNNETTFTITDVDKLSVRESTTLTIINEKALYLAHLKIFYNTGEKVNIKTAAIYNSLGIKVKTIKQSDMADYSTAGDLTLYSDARIIYYKVVPVSYPFTIVYDYEVTYNRLYSFPPYSPYTSDYQSVENSSLKLINLPAVPLNIKLINMPEGLNVFTDEKSKSWSFTNLLPLVDEPYMPRINDVAPLIKIAPELITYDKFKGKADSWENYGKWFSQLLRNRRSLSNTTVTNLNQMVSEAVSKREKVRILYKYMQSKSHYISISEGIEGLQPHIAADVDALGYGDCKDLSNYMVAMLEAVGIKAYYTKVQAGKGEYQFIIDQPGHQSNHIIVCVPMEKDTIWLECTSQISPFNYLGSYTDNRNVLIIKDDSGELARTPEYTINDNYINSTFLIGYATDGTAAKGTITFSGLLMDDVISAVNSNIKDQSDWVDNSLEMTDFTLINHKFGIIEDPKPIISLNVNLALNSFFNGANGRLFASLNLNNTINVPARVRNRQFPVYIPYSYQTNDTILIDLPAGYKHEQLPESVVADERFGNYTMRTFIIGDKITCIRSFRLYKGTHAPELYAAFYDFMQKSAVADAKQLVLIHE